MGKQRIKTSVLELEVLTTFNQTKNFIYNKYYNLYMNKIKIKGVDYQQKDFILRQFWDTGTISMFIMKGTRGSEQAPQGLPVFVPYAASDYNINDWPIHITFINKRGVPFIPHTLQKVDKDCVIGFILRNHKGIKTIVDYYARKIALVHSAIQTQVVAQKIPFVFPVTPENKAYFESLWNDILSDNPKLFVQASSIQDVNVLTTNSVNNIDKLKALADDYENELREMIGINNLGVHEKKEHLINAEIKSNDEATDDNSKGIIGCLNEFSTQAKEVLNYDIEFIWQEEEKDQEISEEEEQGLEDNEEDEE